MSSSTFPTLSNNRLADADGYQIEYEDPAIRTDMEGGYVVSRPRHTRTPRKTFSVKYTDLSNGDRGTLENFYMNDVRGGSMIFDWTNPQDNLVYQVRFKGGLAFVYHGFGHNQRWDCSFKLEQA
jgi:hypothetical protein